MSFTLSLQCIQQSDSFHHTIQELLMPFHSRSSPGDAEALGSTRLNMLGHREFVSVIAIHIFYSTEYRISLFLRSKRRRGIM